MILSIIIVSFNARIDLERCLASLRAAPPQTPHEIVVVDNGSSDGSAASARRCAGVTVVERGDNAGFAKANNVGIRASRGELILLLNSDTIVPPGAIDHLVEILNARPDAAIAGPRLVDGQGRAELSFGRTLGPLNELRQKWRTGRPRVVEALTRRPHAPDWVSGACLLVRRADAEAVGLLDERYFMYIEDVDFGVAMRERGRAVIFTPEVEVVHLRGRSALAAPRATREAYRRSQVAYYEKRRPGWAWALKACLRLRGEWPVRGRR
ncbi:MAG: glycosyltransferase family 2 protein [Acidobacteria bacterium]|nr:glycosyltransferase family 2 protein [Acidobacteriota bacterium]